ncbi:hypothetical protein BMETH_1642_0 [methanotrophic bacterial endosymbiont of Bathymodiolus sp.]|nr:hypothetical protein BMETH_1642_0 [methanotrophic bacterial endosymbiont of Bathymodiolus sp.]
MKLRFFQSTLKAITCTIMPCSTDFSRMMCSLLLACIAAYY